MKFVYLPVYRLAVNYFVNFGRRWSVLEHMLLVETTASRRTVKELSALADLPQRLIIEALINLLRSNWIEVRSSEHGSYFTATPAGIRRALEKELPETLHKDVKWDSVCVDRVTGHWMRADELDLVYERDLPDEFVALEPLLYTFEQNDPALRDLFRLNLNESLEPTPPQFRTPSKPFARIGVAFDQVEMGLPPSAPFTLRDSIVTLAKTVPETGEPSTAPGARGPTAMALDDITPDDIIVGGPEHWDLLAHIFDVAHTTIIIHSCFLGPDTLRRLKPFFEKAARRQVKVELLWGLHNDPETRKPKAKFADCEVALKEMSALVRERVRLSPTSSGSHSKVILYDDKETGLWTSVVGSCNFLSSEFDWIEASVRLQSQAFASKLLNRLLSSQLPAVGNWSPVARRLNGIWSKIKHQSYQRGERGNVALTLITDKEHYACVTKARDEAASRIKIGCDIFGLAAETSVLTPMETAAKLGRQVDLEYSRVSEFLIEEGRLPDLNAIRERQIALSQTNDFHAKYLLWDNDNLVISSFNWLSTVVAGFRSNGAEIGVMLQGPNIANIFDEKRRSVLAARETSIVDQA